ncbi:MAG: hypothetical protein ACREQI_00585 [Candidatus Binataceae bacterium]
MGSFAHFRGSNFSPVLENVLKIPANFDRKLGSFGNFYSFSPIQTARSFQGVGISWARRNRRIALPSSWGQFYTASHPRIMDEPVQP